MGRAINAIDPHPTGDGIEYILVTEAYFNHFSPDLRTEDCRSFKEAYCRHEPWEKNYAYVAFDSVEVFTQKKNLPLLKEETGFFQSKNESKYGYHFSFYSLLNVPGRWITEITDQNPMKCFQLTNAVFIILTVAFLLFFTTYDFFTTVVIACTFCFTSVYWYLGWQHPEILTTCLVTLGFWFFFQQRYYLGIFLVSLAALQNQPLVIILVFMGIHTLIKNGLNKKNFIRIAISGIIVIIPPIFYYINYGTTSIINEIGFLNKDLVTSTRIFGFYFDFNQGLILAAPLILLVYLFLISRETFLMLAKKKPFDFHITLPVFLYAMTLIVCSMTIWNHGMAIINRYATYFSAIIIMHTIYMVCQFEKTSKYVLLNYFFMTQAITILYHEQFNMYDWDSSKNKPLAKYFYDYHPELYNPDPMIFTVRTGGWAAYNPDATPVIYQRKDAKITKIAVHYDKLDNLLEWGFSKEDIENIKKNKKFVNGWAYLNKGEFKLEKSDMEIKNIIHQHKVNEQLNKIRNSPSWLKLIEEKAKERNISTDEMIRVDAEYIVWEAEQEENN